MMETETNGDEQEREALNQRRTQVSSRLLADVDTLEQRRHALATTVDVIQHDMKRLLPIVAGVAGVAVAGVAVWALRRRRRREINLLPWALAELDGVHGPRQKTATRKLVENLAGTLLIAVARRLATRAVVRWVQNQPAAETTAAI